MSEETQFITSFELAIEKQDLAAARALLKDWLVTKVPSDETGLSIGDTLSIIRDLPQGGDDVAIILFRCMSVDGLLPDNNSKNQITRSLVNICTSKKPDFCKFIGVAEAAQTFEKYQFLQEAHNKISLLLSPLTDVHGDLPSIVKNRTKILGILNHSMVRWYCRLFGLQNLKAATEGLFSCLGKVVELKPSFLQDFQESKRSISTLANQLEETQTFLSKQFFSLLLAEIEKHLDVFLMSVRSQYRTDIKQGWSQKGFLQKRYPLHEEDRKFSLLIPFRNEGNGLAMNLRATIVCMDDEVLFHGHIINLGNVAPGDFSIILDATLLLPIEEFSTCVEIEWNEIGNPETLRREFDFVVQAQSKNVDWSAQEYSSPYSTSPAEGENFIGRADLVRDLSGHLLRSPMEPFYVTGQKRVGKTSLVLAVGEMAKKNDRTNGLLFEYILWGDVAHSNSNQSMQLLGQRIEQFIASKLPKEVPLGTYQYDGSLAPLTSLLDLALKLCPDHRFVVALDEFDEIPQELFLQGNLAETFFANLRALSRKKNFCLILVGGENMPFIMDRQGQKLNNFREINLSYFSRDTEWPDFQKMVQYPTNGILKWYDDAISEVFNASNGNPYFAKIVCARVFKNAVNERDTDITLTEVKRAIDSEISNLGKNSFAHLWQDGIPKPIVEREPHILLRSRTLVAAIRCLRRGLALTPVNIFENRATGSLGESDMHAVLNDFVQRNVLSENSGRHLFVLPIFEAWLLDVGAQQLIADTLSEEIADSAIATENKAIVMSNEIVELAESWSTYRGQKIGTDEIRAWLQQVDSHIEQRILFTLLQRTKVFSEILVRERMRTAYALIRSSLPVLIQTKKNEQRNDIIITYIDGQGKSGALHASLYAEENRISAKSIVSQENFSEEFKKRHQNKIPISAIVVVDDIAATGESLSKNLLDFVKNNAEDISGIKIRAMTIIATQSAKDLINRRMKTVHDLVDFEFLTCEIVSEQNYALPRDKTGFSSEDNWDRAKALVNDLGSKIDKRRPLGYGGAGLLVVFPNNVPNNTIPILRSHSRGSSNKWKPIFERVSHL